jgi:hypothetical protein
MYKKLYYYITPAQRAKHTAPACGGAGRKTAGFRQKKNAFSRPFLYFTDAGTGWG